MILFKNRQHKNILREQKIALNITQNL